MSRYATARSASGYGSRDAPPRPIAKPGDVKFKGDAMLVVDFGVFEPGLDLMLPRGRRHLARESVEGGPGGSFIGAD